MLKVIGKITLVNIMLIVYLCTKVLKYKFLLETNYIQKVHKNVKRGLFFQHLFIKVYKIWLKFTNLFD